MLASLLIAIGLVVVFAILYVAEAAESKDLSAENKRLLGSIYNLRKDNDNLRKLVTDICLESINLVTQYNKDYEELHEDFIWATDELYKRDETIEYLNKTLDSYRELYQGTGAWIYTGYNSAGNTGDQQGMPDQKLKTKKAKKGKK